MGIYGGHRAYEDYKSGILSTYGTIYIGSTDILGLGGNPLGTGISLGTSLGRWIVESNWYFKLVHNYKTW